MKLELDNYVKLDNAPMPEPGLTDWVQDNVYNPAANSLIQLRNGVAGIVDSVSHKLGGEDILGKVDYYDVAAPSTPQEYVVQTVSSGAAQVLPYLVAAKVAGLGLRASLPEAVWENSVTRAAGRGLGLGTIATRQLFQETSAAVVGAACIDLVKAPLRNETRLGNVLGGTTAFLTFGVLNPVLAGESHGIAGRIASRAYVGAFGGISAYAASNLVNGKPLTAYDGGRAALTGATINTVLPPVMDATTRAVRAGRSLLGMGSSAADIAIHAGTAETNQAAESPSSNADRSESTSKSTPASKGKGQDLPGTADLGMASHTTNHDHLSLPYYPESEIEHQDLGPRAEQITPETRYRSLLHSLREMVRDAMPEKPSDLVDRKLAFFIDDPAYIGEFMDAVRDKIAMLDAQQRHAEAANLRGQWQQLQSAIPKEILTGNAEPDHRAIGPKEEWLGQDKPSGESKSNSKDSSSQPEWDPAWGNRPGEAEEADPKVWQTDKSEEPSLIYNPDEEPPGWYDSDHKEVGPPSEWLLWEERFKPAWKSLCEEVHNLLPENPTEQVDLRLKTFIDDVSHLGEFMDAVRDKINALNMVKMFDEADLLEHWWKEVNWRLPQNYFYPEPEHRPLGPPEEWLKKPTYPADKPAGWNEEWGEPPGKEQNSSQWHPDAENEDADPFMPPDEHWQYDNQYNDDAEPNQSAQPEQVDDDVFVPTLDESSRPNYKAALESLIKCVNKRLPQQPADALGWKLKFLSSEPSRVGDFMKAVREKIGALNQEVSALQQGNANEAGAKKAMAEDLASALVKLSAVIPESVVAETTTK